MQGGDGKGGAAKAAGAGLLSTVNAQPFVPGTTGGKPEQAGTSPGAGGAAAAAAAAKAGSAAAAAAAGKMSAGATSFVPTTKAAAASPVGVGGADAIPKSPQQGLPHLGSSKG
jgi:hypothetical protein